MASRSWSWLMLLVCLALVGCPQDDDDAADDDTADDDTADDDTGDDDDTAGDDDAADDDTAGDDDDAVDCSAIDAHADWEVCASAPDICEAVFSDSAGCAVVCDAAGLECIGSYENVDGECLPDLAMPALECGSTGHQSDYCVCGLPGAEDPYADETPTEDCDDLAMENLANCANGFGENAVGGQLGSIYHVTNLDNSGAGSLREGAESDSSRWIVFDVSGTIDLSSPIDVGSNTTIDGRGQQVTITGEGLHINGEQHVIVHNLIFDGGDDDAIQIKDGSQHVWIDHLTLSDYYDGLLDITVQATDVTVSWCHFLDHDKTMLISASVDHTADTVIRATLHHNHFDHTNQRHPRLRYGKVHAYNNYYDQWGSYGIGSSQNGQVLSQSNIFEAGGDNDAIITHAGEDPDDGDVRSDNDWAINGAQIDENNAGSVFDWQSYYSSATIETADSTLRSAIEAGAGWQSVPLPPL
jgi:pectate lyase